MRRVQAANPEVLLVDIPGDNPAIAMRAIEPVSYTHLDVYKRQEQSGEDPK